MIYKCSCASLSAFLFENFQNKKLEGNELHLKIIVKNVYTTHRHKEKPWKNILHTHINSIYL